MLNLRNSIPAILLLFAGHSFGASLRALPEFFRPDPFGGTVESDRKGAAWMTSVNLTAARGGYVSFHLSTQTKPGREYRLSVDFPLPTDLYREWFHFNTPDRKYYPDALIPIHSPFESQLPQADNHVAGQMAQAFWVDVWIPASAEPRTYHGKARLSCGSEVIVVPLEIRVLTAVIPERDTVTLDSNSYGTSWLLQQYPKMLAHLREGDGGEDELFRLIQAHHRLFYEHRSTFHQLGYGHAGKVGPEFAPELTGSGRSKHIANWDRFDRHYGPLLDGSAFRDTRHGAHPIPFMYLPVNPEWPASFLWWGEPGYEAEFTNVLSEMERHFREKGWTSTCFEVFFNEKKRYKGFNWDGDEVRFSRDNSNFITYHRMLEKAIPADSPVHFRMRADTSWTMHEQFGQLKGVITFWVAGEGEFGWYTDELPELKQRGDIVWTYGGTPAVQEVSSRITLNPLRSWITGVDGFVRWQTVSPGPDPWYLLGGGSETLIYPGERFGISGPLASIRLKLQRNCLQDLALLESAAKGGSRDRIREEVVRRFNNSTLADWHNTKPNFTSKPVIDWDNADFQDALKPFEARFASIDPAAWLRVRDFALTESGAR
jgi:hypothetical protein